MADESPLRPVTLTAAEARLALDAIGEYLGSDTEGLMHEDELVLAMVTADKIRRAGGRDG